MAGATIAQEGKETKTMTTMAFGKSYAEVGKLLRKGRAVDLAVQFSGDTGDTPAWKRLDEFLEARLQHLDPVLAGREWQAVTFSDADILMADVLRLVARFDRLAGKPPCLYYVAPAHAP